MEKLMDSEDLNQIIVSTKANGLRASHVDKESKKLVKIFTKVVL